ncbi:MAG: hypothetical protein WC551_07530 [Patescibacteria group bacterium]
MGKYADNKCSKQAWAKTKADKSAAAGDYAMALAATAPRVGVPVWQQKLPKKPPGRPQDV